MFKFVLLSEAFVVPRHAYLFEFYFSMSLSEDKMNFISDDGSPHFVLRCYQIAGGERNESELVTFCFKIYENMCDILLAKSFFSLNSCVYYQNFFSIFLWCCYK